MSHPRSQDRRSAKVVAPGTRSERYCRSKLPQVMRVGTCSKVFLVLLSANCSTALFGRTLSRLERVAARTETARSIRIGADPRVRAGHQLASSSPSTSSSLQLVGKTLAVDYDHEDVAPVCALIVMDGFCSYHSGYLVQRARAIPGVAVVHVLSDYLYGYLQSTSHHDPEELEQARRMKIPRTEEQAKEWRNELLSTLFGTPDEKQNDPQPDHHHHRALKIAAVYCESDSGLADAEELRQLLKVEARDNPDCWEARRNKYLMLEACRAVGLPVASQRLCTSKEEARNFAEQELSRNRSIIGTPRVVCKPFRGVASESVYLCSNLQEVDQAWDKITATTIFGQGGNHESILVQECLRGTEYAVDVVSRNGQHKVAAVWRYDKRPANGAPFCYFQTELVDVATDSNVEAVCEYITSSLDALGVNFGLSHCEAIVVDDDEGRRGGPRLVEVNCRQHNMDFLPIVMACIGYNALDMTLVAFLGSEEDWSDYPDMPVLRAHGSMVHLVNYARGRLKQYHYLQEMSDLSSVFDSEVYEPFLTPGTDIEPTINIRSDAGWVQLINPDPEGLKHDYEQIVDWMPKMFETFESSHE